MFSRSICVWALFSRCNVYCSMYGTLCVATVHRFVCDFENRSMCESGAYPISTIFLLRPMSLARFKRERVTVPVAPSRAIATHFSAGLRYCSRDRTPPAIISPGSFLTPSAPQAFRKRSERIHLMRSARFGGKNGAKRSCSSWVNLGLLRHFCCTPTCQMLTLACLTRFVDSNDLFNKACSISEVNPRCLRSL